MSDYPCCKDSCDIVWKKLLPGPLSFLLMKGIQYGVLLGVFVLALLSSFSEAETNEERVAELVHLQSRSKDGVIRLDENGFRRFMSTTSPRMYALILFFDAHQLRGNADLKLEEFRAEYGLVSQAYIKHHKGQPSAEKVFFCDLEFKQAQGVFQLFGIQALPHVRYVPMGSGDFKASEEMAQGQFPRNAEGLASFVTAKTKQACGPIERPPPLSKAQMWALGVVFVAVTPFIYKVMTHPDSPMREPALYCVFVLVIYFFSVSGGMFNIIRNIPLFMQDRNNPGKIMFFYQGSGMQLGTEGFVVGFMYTVVGVLLAFVTHVAPQIRSKIAQRTLMLVITAIGFLAVRKVVALDNWKTGYWIHGFWPSRWR